MSINLYLLQILPKIITQIVFIKKTQQYKYFIKVDKINIFFFILKNQTLLKFEEILDIFCIDYLNLLNNIKRFQINYSLLSISNNIRLLVKCNLNNNISILSLNYLYKSSIWLEREIWDLFGIFILNHPDLRRILTDYGFQGFALRKDFPLSGYTEILYDIEYKKLYLKLIELSQEYRAFEFISPWTLLNTKNL